MSGNVYNTKIVEILSLLSSQLSSEEFISSSIEIIKALSDHWGFAQPEIPRTTLSEEVLAKPAEELEGTVRKALEIDASFSAILDGKELDVCSSALLTALDAHGYGIAELLKVREMKREARRKAVTRESCQKSLIF